MWIKKYITGFLGAIFISLGASSQDIFIDGASSSLGGFICGESHTIQLSDPQTWGITLTSPYCLWQRSDNNGTSWQNIVESGTNTTSIDVVNYDGTKQLYRVIIGESETVASDYARYGVATGVISVPNFVSMQCDPTICGDGENRLVVWKEDFKSVPRGERRECADVRTRKFAGRYNTSSSTNIGDSCYAIVSHSEDGSTPSYNWFSGGTDHTGNKDGGFLLINNPDKLRNKHELIFEKKIDFDLCSDTWYYFSMYAMCVTGGFIRNPNSSGAYPNFLFEIIGEDGTTVLASNQSGEVPVSVYGISTWINYGVSFNSGNNRNVTLRIYDDAEKGVGGDDMAIDDISLIACEKPIPEAILSVGQEQDKEGICGETAQLTLSDMSKWEALLPNVYCVWQTSDDGGATWTNMPESGEKVYSVEVPFQKSAVGMRYRVIIAKDQTSGLFIADHGFSDDACSLYKISNVSTLTCRCATPQIFVTASSSFFCTDPVELSAIVNNGVTADSISWSQQDVSTGDWVAIAGQQGSSISVLDQIERHYCAVAWNDTCHSDSVFITIKESHTDSVPLKITGDGTICENGSTTLTLTGNALDQITWMKREEGESDFSPLGAADAPQATVSPSKTTYYRAESAGLPGQCIQGISDTFTVKVDVPATLTLASSANAVCVNDNVTLSASYGTATAIVWEKKEEGETAFADFSTDLIQQQVVNPAHKTTYRIRSAQNNACPESYSDEVIISTEDSLRVSVEPIQTTLCEGTAVSLKASVTGTPASVTWEKQAGGQTSVLANDKEATDTPTQSCEYTVTAAGQLCPDATQSLSVTVDNKASLTLSASANAVCVNDNVTLSANYGTATAIVWEKKEEGETAFADFSTDLAQQQVVNPTHKTTYRIRSAQNNACPESYSDEVTVSTGDSLRVSVEPIQTTLCEGTAVSLKASVTGTPASVMWEKQVGGQTSVLANDKEATDTPNQSCEYTVTATGQFCPDATQNLSVTVDNHATLTLSASANAVCVNDNVTLSASYGTATAIVWEKKEEGETAFADFSTDLIQQQVVNPAHKTTYRIRSAQNNACPESYSDEVTITTEDSLRVSVEPIQTALCEGTAVSLKASVTGTPASVMWEKQVGGQTSVLANDKETTDTPSQSCEYTVTAAGQLCPDATQSLSVTVDHQASLTLSASANAVCVNDNVTLSASYSTATAIVWEKKEEGENVFADFSTDLTQQQVVNPAHKTTYRIRSAQNNACPESYSDEVTVSTEDSLRMNLQPIAETVKEGNSVSLKATIVQGTPTSFTWEKETDSGKSTLGTQYEATDTPSENSTYIATVHATYCPEVTLSQSIIFKPLIILSLSSAVDTICEGEEVVLTANYGVAEGIAWEKQEEGSSGYEEFATDLTTQKNVTPMVTTRYRIRYTGDDVVYSNDVTIHVMKQVEVELTGDESTCKGSDYTINFRIKNGQDVSSVTLYESVNGEIVNREKIEGYSSGDYNGSSLYTLQDETTFSLKATSQYCPEKEVTHTVTIDTVPTLYELTASADSICRGDLVELSTDFPFSANNLLLTEEYADGSNHVREVYMTSSVEQFQPEEMAHYTLTPRTEKGCVGEKRKLTIHVFEPAQGNTKDTSICMEESAILHVTEGTIDERYIWSTSADFTDTLALGNRQMVHPEETTTYYVKVISGSCEKVLEQTVQIAPKPFISMSQTDAQTITLEGSGGAGGYLFDLGAGFGETNTINNVTPARTYNVRIKDEAGCINDTSFTIQVYDLIIPEYFTPQGDGTNDTWKIINLSRYRQVRVSIFNRFGKKLFESTDPEQEWDGTYNGYALPSEDYWYIINLYDTRVTYKGHFTLIRN